MPLKQGLEEDRLDKLGVVLILPKRAIIGNSQLEELDRLDVEGRIYWPDKDGGWPRLKRYLDEAEGTAVQINLDGH